MWLGVKKFLMINLLIKVWMLLMSDWNLVVKMALSAIKRIIFEGYILGLRWTRFAV